MGWSQSTHVSILQALVTVLLHLCPLTCQVHFCSAYSLPEGLGKSKLGAEEIAHGPCPAEADRHT